MEEEETRYPAMGGNDVKRLMLLLLLLSLANVYGNDRRIAVPPAAWMMPRERVELFRQREAGAFGKVTAGGGGECFGTESVEGHIRGCHKKTRIIS